ncbi:trans-sulfuration enzyme family protein [Desulforhopalus sp. 52FAK]
MEKYSELQEQTNIVHGLRSCYTTSMDLVPPIHMTSTFKFRDQAHGAAVFSGSEDAYLYSRINNPTVRLLEEKMAFLEGSEDAIATSSGMAAAASIVMSLARPGDNIVACNALYGGTFALFQKHLADFKIETRFLSPRDSNNRNKIDSLVDARTRLLFCETPANPTIDIIDISLWAAVAHENNVPLAVDNTFASTYLQKPISLGADIVLHSATKYLGGHGDVIGGVITTSRAITSTIREAYFNHFGPAMSPFNGWLILRGLKTLAIRMERHSSSAITVASWLEKHPQVEKVYYPGLPSHPNYKTAVKQMKAFSGIVSFELKNGIEAGKTVINNVELCTLAVSLGDCETLIQHPASMTHSTYSTQKLKEAGIGEGLIRLSVGLEHPDDIIADLSRALKKV